MSRDRIDVWDLAEKMVVGERKKCWEIEVILQGFYTRKGWQESIGWDLWFWFASWFQKLVSLQKFLWRICGPAVQSWMPDIGSADSNGYEHDCRRCRFVYDDSANESSRISTNFGGLTVDGNAYVCQSTRESTTRFERAGTRHLNLDLGILTSMHPLILD